MNDARDANPLNLFNPIDAIGMSNDAWTRAGDGSGTVPAALATSALAGLSVYGAGKAAVVGAAGLAMAAWRGLAETVAEGADETITLFHGSTANATNILSNGLDTEGASATYVSTDQAAAQNAIDYRMQNFPQDVTDPGVIKSVVSVSDYNALVNSGDILVRPYQGFYPYNLNTSEILLKTGPAKALFNSGITP